jgi:hypothetical protein
MVRSSVSISGPNDGCRSPLKSVRTTSSQKRLPTQLSTRTRLWCTSRSASTGLVQLSISDDGFGGADPGRGSGLVGLRDRVEALGGRIEILSPAGARTSLLVTVPIDR